MSFFTKFLGMMMVLVAAEVAAAEFAPPTPPPELGDTLTTYRTKQQRMENSLEVRQENAYVDQAAKKKKRKNSLMNQIENSHEYVPNMQVIVYSRGETVLTFLDRKTLDPMNIKNFQVSNKRAFILSEGDARNSIVLVPTGAATNAKVKVELDGERKKVMIFNIRYSTQKYEIRNIQNVGI